MEADDNRPPRWKLRSGPRSITVELNNEETAQMTKLTNQHDEALAVAQAAREYLRIRRLCERSVMSGQVDYDDNWQWPETLELAEVDFPR
jgi:hypothetical protein